MKRREPTVSKGEGGYQIAEQEGLISSFYKQNKAVRVSFSGGLIGIFLGSSRGRVDAVLKRENAAGWNLAEVIPDNPNLAIWLLRLVFLIVTLGLWTLSTGYIFIFEKPR
ncbi:hypothetical protein [Candidatus Rhodobacter oscarellae]|uniref:hypothetical protein n=1 Tax=Candidatus Rhodobacter oscarellae TaxID=1675527 RepID=UPI00128F2632|nr:hypothetical protein [Candidatus Rhodobacter lobularis]